MLRPPTASKMAEERPDQAAIQKTLDNRAFLESVRSQVRVMSDFLGSFESTVRTKLADMESKVTSLERKLEYVEEQFATAGAREARAGADPPPSER
mmetsp:Transcript_30662/g.99726  ORF Transcript_30662/g.99726 Transcript_30662/m.99726 type:complete len:96 (+) Transcript_30662:2-289(+)